MDSGCSSNGAARSEQRPVGVYALVGEAAQRRGHGGLVLPVGHTVPAVGRGEHIHGAAALAQQRADLHRDVHLGLFGVLRHGVGKKARKAHFQLGKQAGRKAPHIHGHEVVRRHRRPVLAILGEGGAAVDQLDARALHDVGQAAVCIGFAHAARDGAMLGQRVGQPEADHAVVVDPIPVGAAAQPVVQQFIGMAAVIVVRVDHGEGTVDQAGAAQDGVRRAPWLPASLGNGKPVGQALRELLIHIVHLHVRLDAVAHDVAKVIRDTAVDDEYHALKPGADGVEERIVDDDLSVRADGIDLLEPAVARAKWRNEY